MSRWRVSPAADLHQSVRRPGRTGVRRRVLCAQCRLLVVFQLPAFGDARPHDEARRAAGGWCCTQAVRQIRTRRITVMRGCAITSTRTASRVSCSACPAVSIWRAARGHAHASGADRVRCVMLPRFRFTSQVLPRRRISLKALGMRYDIVPIEVCVEGLGGEERFAARRARRYRGEFAGPRPRHHPDGDFQQIRLMVVTTTSRKCRSATRRCMAT